MKKSALFLLFCFLTTPAFLTAQSAALEIETLLQTSAVTYAQATRFVLEASDALATSSHEEAFRYAAERNWLPKNASPDGAARLNGISLLLMQSFGIKGGIMYSITKSPHYAYREMVYRNTIQGRADPAMRVSGENLLFYINRILSQLDDTAAEQAERTARRDRDAARREALAAEINATLKRQNVANVSAQATDRGIIIRLSDIQFLADSTELPESEKRKLQEIANILKTIPDKKIQVAGHTAMAGTAENRVRISLERAQAVAAYLVLLGAHAKEDITAVGYGAEFPLADNSTPEGMAANRRVEITILEN